MRRLVLLFASSALACFFIATAAAASQPDYYDLTVAALQHSHVYVAPGTEGTDSTTASQFEQLFNPDNNITIIMLPANAISTSNSSMLSFASEVDQALGNNRVIGMSVGGPYVSASYIAYAPTFPSGEAQALLVNAEAVSNSSTGTLKTFIADAQSWEQANPTPSPKKANGKGSGGSAPLSLILAIVAVGLCIAVIAMNLMKKSGHNQPPIKAADTLKTELEDLYSYSSKVRDTNVQVTLRNILVNTEEYFKRAKQGGVVRDVDIDNFRENLKTAVLILKQYVDIQDHPQFYEDAQGYLKKGADAINSFSNNVLASIRAIGRRNLSDFNISTDILDATKYS